MTITEPIRDNSQSELSAKLSTQLSELQYLAWVQRSARLGLRALWLGMGGFLLAWSANTLWGWLPDPRTWFLVGFILALVPFIAFLLSLSRRSRWVWIMDRRLGLQEQVSTAWEVIHSGRPGQLTDALVTDVLQVLPKVRQRMLRHGWFLERDLVSALIVVLLAGMVAVSTLVRPVPEWAGDAPQALSPPDRQGQPPPQQPESQAPGSGDEGQGAQQDGQAPGQDGAQPQPGSEGGQAGGSQAQPDSSNPGSAAEALRELGSRLRQQAPTYDLGQSLEELDLGSAAEDLENLTDQLDQLSPETRQELADAMGEAAEDLDAAGQDSLAQDMGQAAQSLSGEPDESTSEAMGQVAQDLRELAEDMQQASRAAGDGAGDGSGQGTGSPEPITRLNEEGGEMELPIQDPSESGLLSPASPDAAGSGTASGSLDSTAQGGDDVIQSPLVPNSFLWKWRDVVSSYFRR